MEKYKISVSKNQKKYSIVLNALSESEARKKVHSEGYSILSVEKLDEGKIDGHKFLFEAIDKNGNKKKGKIVAKDPFKVYVKLKGDLGYDVTSLFSEDYINITTQKKQELLEVLEQQYILYTAHANKTKNQTEVKKDINKEKNNLENFYLKKELEETQKLIEFVLKKLQKILKDPTYQKLGEEKMQKLQTIYNGIIKIKKTSNISKIREVGELALLKIGKIELEIIKKEKIQNESSFLQETNVLLKKIGSKEVISNKTHKGIFGNKKEGFFKRLKNIPSIKTKKGIDKESASYWKTELLLNKYREKLDENRKNILKKIHLLVFVFGSKKEPLETLFIKRKVIQQNISLLSAKKTGKIKSYTKIIHGYEKIIYFILNKIKFINKYIFALIFSFAILFIVYVLANKLNMIDLHLKIKGIYFFIYILFTYLFICFIRGLITLIISVVILLFLLILGGVNF